MEGGGETGIMGESGGGVCTSPTGDGGSVGSNTAIAEHLSVGFPVVPGGHAQTGR